MPDLNDGESTEMKGSGSKPYILKNVGGVYSCTCPAWRNQSVAIERRSCKHIRKLRGDDAEEARIGSAAPPPPRTKTRDDEAPPLLLAEPWDGVADPAGWWLSEKLDGVRAYWNGKEFLSRLGNRYLAPDWFVEGLPETPLDGELWLGRKQFQRAVGIVKRQDKSDFWKEIRFLVFDAPALDVRFEERLAAVKEALDKGKPAFAQAHDHTLCRSADHLRDELSRVEGLGGEGLMLRQPRSNYEVGRSSTLLKVKRFLDAEAHVVGHEPGKGRHMGRLGAVVAQLADGTRFSVGTGFSDAERSSPPPLGSTITFRYQELSDAGVPRFPSYVGVRHDAVVTPRVAVAPVTPTPAAPSPVVVPAAPPAVGAAPRHFEFREGASSKFWEVSVSGNEMTVRYGRIGATGQTKTKAFADAATAEAQAAKLVAEKTADGYVES
jgi:DNA ligase-1